MTKLKVFSSVFPSSFAKKHNLSLKPKVILCATGKRELASETKAIDVVVCGTITKLGLIVFDRQNGLLGVDWFNANKAYVNTSNMTLCFENKKFSLDNKDGDD